MCIHKNKNILSTYGSGYLPSLIYSYLNKKKKISSHFIFMFIFYSNLLSKLMSGKINADIYICINIPFEHYNNGINILHLHLKHYYVFPFSTHITIKWVGTSLALTVYCIVLTHLFRHVTYHESSDYWEKSVPAYIIRILAAVYTYINVN